MASSAEEYDSLPDVCEDKEVCDSLATLNFEDYVDRELFDGSKIAMVKAVVACLLTHATDVYVKRLCPGCQSDVFNFKRHTCFDERDDHFMFVRFRGLMRVLWSKRFIPTVQRVLRARDICVPDAKLNGYCEMFLYNLRYSAGIDIQITRLVNEAHQNYHEWNTEMIRAVRFWKGIQNPDF